MNLDELFKARRDTRHFTSDPVPDEVLQKALNAGHAAPSVGLTDATRYFVVRSEEVKLSVKALFEQYNQKASGLIQNDEQKALYQSIKLEAIVDAPLGLIVAYDRSVLNNFTIGTIATNDTIKFSAVCAVQNIWLSLTEQGYSMGWVSILNYHHFKKLLDLPDEIEPLGYFCVGKPATDYDKQPMLQQLGWKEKSEQPLVQQIERVQEQKVSDVGAADTQQERSAALGGVLKQLIDEKTKPLGALGYLEDLAQQIGEVFQTTHPQLTNPHLLVFAADHGIAQHGVSAYPQEVTRQMVNNFLEGGAAINVFCRQNGINLKVVDAGVNYDFPSNTAIINAKIARGTQSCLQGPAMSSIEFDLCLQRGAELLKDLKLQGCNTIAFGEMGIGNTSSAALLMSVLCDIPIEQCVGKGTGLNPAQLDKKTDILKQALLQYQGAEDIREQMAYFGGFEILQIAGGILEAHRQNMLILVDGFICTTAYLCAYKLNPQIKFNTVFCHQSDEAGHKLLLAYLGVKPLLQLGLRLGEGTGCALAFPLIKSAVAFLNEMASFESASVSKKQI